MTRELPETAEGWYALHDFRSIDWDAWRDAPERVRERALSEGVTYLDAHETVSDADEGASAVFSVLGHKADLLIVHFRPTMADLDTAERAFEGTAFADFTERATSYVSVTEVGGYTSEEMTKDPSEIEDTGLARYVQSKLEPSIPDTEFVSFYPMSKRRLPEYNWYDLPFDERAEMMASHGEIGKQYAGKVNQVITGSIAMDDWEWGVTVFSDDVTHLKDLLYEMRFDEGSSKYAEFGQFYIARRFPPSDLDAFMAGEPIPAEDESPHGHGHGSGDEGHHGHHGSDSSSHHDHGSASEESGDGDDIRGELEGLNIYAGKPHGEDVYAMVLYSEADVDELADEVDGLRGNFEHYDTHVKTTVYDAEDETAVVSIWETKSAADTAGGFLADLPGIVRRAGEDDSTFGTMGMFYTVKPERREEFVEKFETVGEVLADTEGHLQSDLLANVDDENDMFIASQWETKDDAMAFFRSDAFTDTVDWGRDVLVDRPRHVFLA